MVHPIWGYWKYSGEKPESWSWIVDPHDARSNILDWVDPIGPDLNALRAVADVTRALADKYRKARRRGTKLPPTARQAELPGTCPVVPAEVVRALLEDYKRSGNMRAVARKYGVHRSTVQRLRDQACIPGRQPALSDKDAVKAAQMYAEGLSLAKVGMHFGVTARVVRTVVVNSGGEVRRPGGYR